jgi:hypothetical protein
LISPVFQKAAKLAKKIPWVLLALLPLTACRERRGEDGWQLDFAAMNRLIGFNHLNQWFFRDRSHPWKEQGSDQGE